MNYFSFLLTGKLTETTVARFKTIFYEIRKCLNTKKNIILRKIAKHKISFIYLIKRIGKQIKSLEHVKYFNRRKYVVKTT